MILRVPTELSEKQIEEFQQIFKKTYGVDITREEAIEEGLNLIEFVAIVIDKSI